MVSFWPWRGGDNSPASFEKSLSAIAKKIGTANTSLESSRQQARRFKALWTLYASIAYLLYGMIIGLVVGLKSSGVLEVGGLIAGPVVIYSVRKALASIYAYRTTRQEAYLQGLQKQRDGIIKKLKDATKYDSTQQLLEKYGGTPAKPKKAPSNRKPGEETLHVPGKSGRTMIVPPPTANIPRGPLSAPQRPQDSTPVTPIGKPPFTAAAATPPWAQQNSPASPSDISAEFAPNAFPAPAGHYAAPGFEHAGGNWYDRIMDVLLGEDESHPKNRLVLICKECRLVNGQAPPGVKALADVGKWRCSACGTMNGEESEMSKIVAEIQGTQEDTSDKTKIGGIPEEDSMLMGENGSSSDIELDSDGEAEDTSAAQSGRATRSATARKSRKFEE